MGLEHGQGVSVQSAHKMLTSGSIRKAVGLTIIAIGVAVGCAEPAKYEPPIDAGSVDGHVSSSAGGDSSILSPPDGVTSEAGLSDLHQSSAVDGILADSSGAVDAVDAPAISGDVNVDQGIDAAPTCPSGQYRCGPDCVRDTDSSRCGQACMKCPAGSNEHPVCMAGTCRVECSVSCSESPSVCQRASWDFESGSNEGLGFEEGGISVARAHSGRYSAASRKWIKAIVVEGGYIQMTVKLCGGTTNLEGRTISAWAYLEGPEFVPGRGSECSFGYDLDVGFKSTRSTAIPATGQWFQISATAGQQTKTSDLYLICWVRPKVGDSWQGTVYFDDVRVD